MLIRLSLWKKNPVKSDPYGVWMLVKRKPRKKGQGKQNPEAKTDSEAKKTGSKTSAPNKDAKAMERGESSGTKIQIPKRRKCYQKQG